MSKEEEKQAGWLSMDGGSHVQCRFRQPLVWRVVSVILFRDYRLSNLDRLTAPIYMFKYS